MGIDISIYLGVYIVTKTWREWTNRHREFRADSTGLTRPVKAHVGGDWCQPFSFCAIFSSSADLLHGSTHISHIYIYIHTLGPSPNQSHAFLSRESTESFTLIGRRSISFTVASVPIGPHRSHWSAVTSSAKDAQISTNLLGSLRCVGGTQKCRRGLSLRNECEMGPADGLVQLFWIS